MGQKIVVGPINRGLRNDVTAFNIDNDNFPTLINAYQWRGKVKRKRGTSLLGRLTRFFNSTSLSYSSISSFALVLGGGGASGNLFTGFNLEANGNIVPGSVSITDTTTGNVYTDPGLDGILVGAPSGSGTINYATGEVFLVILGAHSITAIFRYTPDLPVMGLEDLILTVNQYPGTLAFDTVYSYNISPLFPYPIYDVSFYKNPPTGAYTNYVQKTTVTPTWWNGEDYQQFWTVNYQGALWATNGIKVPFSVTNIGMQFKRIVTVTVLTATTATLNILTHGLVVGDFVFINEVLTTTGINFQTGYVTTVTDANNVIVTFPNATLATNGTGGIAQYLTNRSDTTLDGIRWYDGDPTNGNATTPILNGMKGWVNFAPPLSEAAYSIADTPAAIYYLVGARIILPFKDRLLFIGPVIQTSAVGATPIYLQDTIIYSQNGTPYYTASYTNTPNAAIDTPTSSTNVFNPLLVPVNQTATSTAYFEDVTGFGGFVEAGIDQPILTASSNADVLILGFDRLQVKLVYTGNDVVPFNLFQINSELGSSSTFSVINMDEGVLTRGNRGYIITNQSMAKRIDLDIPDEVFQMSLVNNGAERVTAQRDFISEWVYFTYPADQVSYKFPNQTLQYNYRDNSWAIFYESYTHYGQFRKQTGFTWASVGTIYPTWSVWNDPWSAGVNTLKQAEVIAGNQQGFVMIRDDGTDEGASLYIQSIIAGVITSPQHNLNTDDYIIISDALGTIGAQVNNKIFSVLAIDANTFSLNPPISTGTYLGNGYITKMYVPLVQTKQFPVAWEMGRKTRIGVQQYLLTFTPKSQIQLLIFLSQNSAGAYNLGPVVPAASSTNNGLVYSTVLYTCPESTNLGLTPANINLNMVTANEQEYIWHRMNTSLLGDTVQLGFSLSDTQMRSLDTSGDTFSITGVTLGTTTILATTGEFSAGHLVRITGIVGTTQLNYTAAANNNYSVISSTPTAVTINVDSSAFTAYISGGTAVQVSPLNQFAEIELHGFILDVSPSMVLA